LNPPETIEETGKAEIRSDSDDNKNPSPSDEFWYQNIFLSMLSGGQSVNPDSAKRLASVYSCITVISETIAMLSVNVFEKTDEFSKKKAKDHPLTRLLREEPNRWMDPFTFFELLQRHLLYRGNAYCQKIMNRNGKINELIPLHPSRVEVSFSKTTSELVYLYNRPDGGKKEFSQQEIFHLRNQSEDGITGRSPIEVVADSIGFGLNLLDHGNAMFANGARPDGLLKVMGTLKDEEAISRLRDQWQSMHGGAQKSGKVAVLEQGTEYEPISMNMRDAQFIEARKFSVEEIARIFRMPPHMIQELSRATFSNIEEQSINFIRYTIQPWLKRWEHAISYQLIDKKDRNDLFVRFKTDSLLRGDFKSRSEAYASAIQNGYMSRDEVRSQLDLNPIPENKGEDFLVPLNLGIAGEEPDEEEKPAKEEIDNKAKKEKKAAPEIGDKTDDLFHFVFTRALTKEANALKRLSKKEQNSYPQLLTEFYVTHSKFMSEALGEIADIVTPLKSEPLKIFIETYCGNRIEEFTGLASAHGAESTRFVVENLPKEAHFRAKALTKLLKESKNVGE